jgi:hypothetical protein
MRRNIVVLRTSMKVAAAVLAGGVAVSACGTIQLGAAAITGNSRISTSTLTSQVANLSSAYEADQAKGIKPQRPTAQKTQQVLTWLILFRVYDTMAAQQGISVTGRESQQALQPYATQAAQSHVTLQQFFSAGAALPPDLLPDFGQAAAIQTALVNRITGGTPPTTSSGQAAVSSQLGRDQCLAAKSLRINVNPQYGEFNYNGYMVVPAPPTLAADPIPSPSASPALLLPPC